MTHEEQGPRPEDTLVPPTSTRWSEEASGGGEDGLLAPFIPGQSRRTAAERPAPEQPAEHPPEQPEEWPEASGGTAEPEPPDVADEPFPFDMPWDDEEPEDLAAGAAEGVAPPEGDFAPEGYGAASGYGDEGFESPAYEEPDLAAGGAAGGAAEQVAARLEMLASRLRAEGAEGVERELASSDRLTSLLAAVLAGHLASR